METKNLLKSLKRRLGLITAILAMLAVSQGAMAADCYLKGGFDGWGDGRKFEGTDYPYVLHTNIGTNWTCPFKIQIGGSWYGNGGQIDADVSGWSFSTSDGDCKISLGSIGDVTFIVTSGPKVQVIYGSLYGDFGSGWKDYYFESDGSVSVNISSTGDKQFKVKKKEWYGINNTPTMTRNNCTDWGFYQGQDNVKVNVDVAGTYKFKWNNSGNKLSITYPTCTATKPTVVTAEADDVTEDSATLGGNVTDAGISTSCSAQTVSGRGIEWTNSSGTPSGTKVSAAAGGTGTFTVSATSLTGGTTYYYKAYATNATGTSYGDMESFTTETPCTPPTVTTAAASNITADGATVGGSYEGGTDTPTSVGIEWTAGTTGSVEIASSGTTPFSKTITGLSSGTTYTYKAYVMACGSKVYASETKSFKTLCVPTNPSVSTVGATSIGTTYATIGCNVTSAGMNSDCSTPSITAKGIEWTQGKSGQESIGSGTGSSTKQITGLTPGTEYKYKAFATNASGTSYGEVKSFTTLGVHGDITGLPASPVAKCSGEELQLAPQCSTATSWSYSSSATGVATVSNTGLIEAVGAGSAVITVTAKADNYIDKSVQITVNVSASPAVSASSNNTTAYEVITLTSTSGSVTWSKSDAAAYFVKDNQAVDGDTVDAVSVNFKAPAKNTDYTVTAEGSNGCTSNLSITISTPTEVCN